MWAEWGVFALIMSLMASVLLVAVPTWGLFFEKQSWVEQARYYAVIQWLFSALAFMCLEVCFLQNDFTLLYVRANSSFALPWFYKLCALWGGHEGSMLLWLCLLQTWTLAVVCWSRSLDCFMRARVLVVLGGLSLGFLLYILLASNPFVRTFDGSSTLGRDLNPLLQDPGFLFHPPMLYMGYVGLAIPFAFAIATLWAGKLDLALVRWARPWTLFAWSCLTLGVTLGSWWAYRELGWGGYWFWDPVENASFMPWLVGIALIHSLIVVERRSMLVAWVLLLSILAFSLSLVGTFLVRSGVLTSVHAFAVDPLRGLAILQMLGVSVGGSLLLYACRAHRVMGQQGVFLFSREMLFLLSNVFLVVGVFTVLLGTIYPLLIEGLGLGKLSVGAPYFNTVFIPLMLPFLFLMGFAFVTSWGENRFQTMMKLVWVALCLSLMIFVLGSVWDGRHLWSWLGIALGAWLILTSVQGLWRKGKRAGFRQLHGSAWGMALAHLGMAMSVLGIAASSGFGQQTDVVLAVGQSTQFAGYGIHFSALSPITGPNYHGVKARFDIQGPYTAAQIEPEKRIYEVSHMPMSEAAVDVNPFRDVYLALGDPVSNEEWTVRLYYKPLVRWIWLGGFMMCLGAFVVGVNRGRRIPSC